MDQTWGRVAQEEKLGAQVGSRGNTRGFLKGPIQPLMDGDAVSISAEAWFAAAGGLRRTLSLPFVISLFLK